MKLVLFLLVLLSTTCGYGQDIRPNRVLFENKYFRASSLIVAKDTPQKIVPKQHALLIVPINEMNLSESTTLPAGSVLYVPQGSKWLSLASTSVPSKVVVVELLQNYDDVQACAAPKQCTRPIRFGEGEVGETASLFRGGGLTVDRHRIVPGASLTSNYFTAHMQSHVLLVALTDVDASFGGDAQALTPGNVYFTDAEQADISAGRDETRWVAIRVLGKPVDVTAH
jgi:hypothetical protein